VPGCVTVAEGSGSGKETTVPKAAKIQFASRRLDKRRKLGVISQFDKPNEDQYERCHSASIRTGHRPRAPGRQNDISCTFLRCSKGRDRVGRVSYRIFACLHTTING